MRTMALLFALGATAAALTGCGRSGPRLYDVSGTVTVNGKPLDQGTIAMDPADGKGDACGGEISGGRFRLRASTGPKRVTICAYCMTDMKGPDGNPIRRQYLPNKYNLQSQLKADVSPDQANDFEFCLEGGP